MEDSQLIRGFPTTTEKFLPGSSKGRAAPQGRTSQEHRTTVPHQSRCNSTLSQQSRKNRVLITSPTNCLRHGSVMNHQDPSRVPKQQQQKQDRKLPTYNTDPMSNQATQDKRLSSSTAQTRNVCLGQSLNGAPGPMGGERRWGPR